jgi:hypothetical protein
MWFRVFGAKEAAPEPAALLEQFQGPGGTVAGHFTGDELGWFSVEFVLPNGPTLRLQRYLAVEDDIRDDLNAWAAWLETVPACDAAPRLMQHLIGAKQVFALDCPRAQFEEPAVAAFCLTLCRYLARQTQGVYQIDARGFFNADDELLVKE